MSCNIPHYHSATFAHVPCGRGHHSEEPVSTHCCTGLRQRGTHGARARCTQGAHGPHASRTRCTTWGTHEEGAPTGHTWTWRAACEGPSLRNGPPLVMTLTASALALALARHMYRARTEGHRVARCTACKAVGEGGISKVQEPLRIAMCPGWLPHTLHHDRPWCPPSISPAARSGHLHLANLDLPSRVGLFGPASQLRPATQHTVVTQLPLAGSVEEVCRWVSG